MFAFGQRRVVEINLSHFGTIALQAQIHL